MSVKSKTVKIVDRSNKIKQTTAKLAQSIETKYPDIFEKLTRTEREIIVTEIENLLMGAMYAVVQIVKQSDSIQLGQLEDVLTTHSGNGHEKHTER